MEIYNNLEEQVDALCEIMKGEDVKKLVETDCINLFKAVVLKDKSAIVDMTKITTEFLFHLPTMIFWEKMRRFLSGCYLSELERIKLAEKFNDDNKKYAEFVKGQVAIIDAMDFNRKIDDFSRLTRCFLIYDMDVALYFRLAKLIQNCTAEELDFVRRNDYKQHIKNNGIVSMLIIQGIYIQERNGEDEIYYTLSSFGKLLKKVSLNFEEDGNIIDSEMNYYDVEGIPQMEPIKWGVIDELLKVELPN